jgi:putative permease
MPKIMTTARIQLIFFISLLVLGIMGVATLSRLAIPLGLAYISYLITAPLIVYLMKMGLNKISAITVVFIGLALLSSYPIIKVVPAINKQTKHVQYYFPKIEHYLKVNYQLFRTKLKKHTGMEVDGEAINDFINYGQDLSKSVLLNIPVILTSLLEWILLVPLFLFFLLKDGNNFKRLVLGVVPNSIFERFYYLFHQFNKQLGGYILAKFIEASIVGIIITIGLIVLDVRFSFLLGLLAAITNIIPYLGPVIGAIPAILLGLVEYGPNSTFMAIVILYTVANVIDLALVFPILVSQIVDLHPVIVVISVIVGSQYLGVIGMVISIPLAAAAKLFFIEIYKELYKSSYR